MEKSGRASPIHFFSYGALISALVLLLTVYLFVQLTLNPDVGFLPPSLASGQWILAPQSLCSQKAPECNAAVFKREIYISEETHVKAPGRMTLTAARGYELFINGILISEPALQNNERNWRRSQVYDLTNYLKHGKNVLEVIVWNHTRQPALLITGTAGLASGMESRAIDTDLRWQVTSLPKAAWAVPELMTPLRDFYPGHLADYERQARRNKSARIAAALLVYAVMVLAFILYRRERKINKAASHRGIRSSFSRIPEGLFKRRWLLYVVLFAALYLPMAVIRNPGEGWDAQGHIDYVRYVASNWKIPLRDQGWQMYQPPAYYFLAAAVYRAALPISQSLSHGWGPASPDFLALKAVQILTPFFALLQILIVLKLVKCLFKEPGNHLLATIVFVFLLPMQIYVSSFISTEWN